MTRSDYSLIRRIGGPSLEDLVQALREYRDELRTYDPQDILMEGSWGSDGEEIPGGDVRLQVYPGDESRRDPWGNGSFWALRTGCSDYDQDHRGYWGSSSVSTNATMRELRETARDLMSQVLEQYCEDQEVPHVR